MATSNLPMAQIRSKDSITCGEDAKAQFGFEPGYRNLNHGSYGTYPASIKPVLRHYQDASEARPDEFIRYEFPEALDESRAAIAKYLNVPVETCVFVPNATTGVNTVLRNLVYKTDDVIIYFATIYGACEKTVSYITETTPAEAHKIEYTYPVSDDHLCTAFESAVKDLRSRGKNPKVAIFDTIVSMPGIRMPFERLTDLCKRHNVLSCIDGAHGIGHIPLDLSTLDPDFFVSNCHKWLYMPRGCAIFYVPLRNQHLIRSTLPTSHGFEPRESSIANPLPASGKSAYVTNFEFVGTMDYTPFLCVPAALEWRSKLTAGQGNKLRGEDAIFAHSLQLARRSGEIVSRVLGTEVLENAAGTLGNCNFANVRLPLDARGLGGGEVAAVREWLVDVLTRGYKTPIPIVFYDGAWWVRLSATVYLTERDFEVGAEVLREACERVKKGEWKKVKGAKL